MIFVCSCTCWNDVFESCVARKIIIKNYWKGSLYTLNSPFILPQDQLAFLLVNKALSFIMNHMKRTGMFIIYSFQFQSDSFCALGLSALLLWIYCVITNSYFKILDFGCRVLCIIFDSSFLSFVIKSFISLSLFSFKSNGGCRLKFLGIITAEVEIKGVCYISLIAQRMRFASPTFYIKCSTMMLMEYHALVVIWR